MRQLLSSNKPNIMGAYLLNQFTDAHRNCCTLTQATHGLSDFSMWSKVLGQV